MTELRFIKINTKHEDEYRTEIRLQYREIIQPEKFGEMTIEGNWTDIPIWDSEKQELKPNFNLRKENTN